MSRVLVTGGVRSGKSRYAEGLMDAGSPALYLTPGYPADPEADPEWAARVAVHQARRPVCWSTRETLDLLAVDAPADHEPVIYANDPDELLGLVAEAPEDAGTLLLVGHNPSVHQFVHDLTGESPATFPTCALAVIALPGAWREVRPGLGTLRTVHTPKD